MVMPHDDICCNDTWLPCAKKVYITTSTPSASTHAKGILCLFKRVKICLKGMWFSVASAYKFHALLYKIPYAAPNADEAMPICSAFLRNIAIDALLGNSVLINAGNASK